MGFGGEASFETPEVVMVGDAVMSSLVKSDWVNDSVGVLQLKRSQSLRHYGKMRKPRKAAAVRG